MACSTACGRRWSSGTTARDGGGLRELGQAICPIYQRRHPRQLGGKEVSSFLSHLASCAEVSASTQNQALAALLFLYSEVLQQPLAALGSVVHAKRPMRLPVVMSRSEVGAVLAQMQGVWRLMASLFYGSGLRLLECASLRVKDVDFDCGQILVRRAKLQKDRVTLLPRSLVEPLQFHLAQVRARHQQDLAEGAGNVALPGALRSKYPNASREWPWQWVFPATGRYLDAATHEQRRHHLHETALLGHHDVRTTMIYTHVVDRGPFGVKSPLDR